jgi:RNase P/RNase MRP subunit POP5
LKTSRFVLLIIAFLIFAILAIFVFSKDQKIRNEQAIKNVCIEYLSDDSQEKFEYKFTKIDFDNKEAIVFVERHHSAYSAFNIYELHLVKENNRWKVIFDSSKKDFEGSKVEANF